MVDTKLSTSEALSVSILLVSIPILIATPIRYRFRWVSNIAARAGTSQRDFPDAMNRFEAQSDACPVAPKKLFRMIRVVDIDREIVR